MTSDKTTGAYITRGDFDGLETKIELGYMSDIVANSGASGRSGVEGSIVLPSFEAGLWVANLSNTDCKAGAGGGDEKSEGKFGICMLHIIKNAFSRLGREWVIGKGKEVHMRGKSFAQLQAPSDRPLFSVIVRASPPLPVPERG